MISRSENISKWLRSYRKVGSASSDTVLEELGRNGANFIVLIPFVRDKEASFLQYNSVDQFTHLCPFSKTKTISIGFFTMWLKGYPNPGKETATIVEVLEQK